MEYLENMGTNGFERQKRLRERKQEKGIRRTELWVTDEELSAIKAAYPGPRGGTDWSRVIKAALSVVGAEHHQEDQPQ